MAEIKSVLIYGATGDQGELQLEPLRRGGYEVRAAVRNPHVEDARFRGMERVHADYAQPTSLVQASAGMDAILLNLPFIFDRELALSYGQHVVDAAKRQGVRLIVFNTSAYIADHEIGLSAHDGRVAVEAVIRASGIAHVILRPVVFMDNLLRAWEKPSIVEHGVFAYPAAPELKISWLALADLAQYMVAALRAPQAWNASHVVGGPEVLVGDQVAARLGQGMGRPIRFQSITPDEFARRMSKLITGADQVEPDGIWDRMAQFYRWYNAQPVSPLMVDTPAIIKLLPIKPTLLADWAQRQSWA